MVSLLMPEASAQSYSVIILVLLQLVSTQAVAGSMANKSSVSGFVNVAGNSILFVYWV